MRWPRSLGDPGNLDVRGYPLVEDPLRLRRGPLLVSTRKSHAEHEPEAHEGRSADQDFRLTRGMGAVAQGAARDGQGGLAQDRQEGRGRGQRVLSRGARSSDLLWLDRWTEGCLRRGLLVAAVHPAETDEQMVEDQPRQSRRTD